MSKDMLTVPRDLLQDLTDDVADYAVSRTFKDRETTWRSDLLDRARALLARQPAAIDKEADDDIEEAREILENMVRSIELDGNYSTEATCTFLRQALNCLPVAAPLANEASKPAASETRWYKHIDAEGNPYWLHTPPAAPSVEQDEPVVMIQGRFVLEADPDFPDLPTHSAWSEIPKESADRLKAKYGDKIELRELVARAASTSANVAQGAEVVAWFYYEDGEFIRMYDSEEKARIAVEKFGGDYEPVFRRAALTAAQSASGDKS